MPPPVNDPDDPHLGRLIAGLYGAFRAALADTHHDAPPGLRASHLRVLDAIGPATAADDPGLRTTDLARRLGMTKQGAGQLVATLVELGYVGLRDDPDDGRARRLHLTEEGLRTRRRTVDRISAVETDWAARVGAEDYRAFRRVALLLGGDDDGDGADGRAGAEGPPA